MGDEAYRLFVIIECLTAQVVPDSAQVLFALFAGLLAFAGRPRSTSVAAGPVNAGLSQ